MESITKYIQLRKTDKDYSIKLPSALMMVSKDWIRSLSLIGILIGVPLDETLNVVI